MKSYMRFNCLSLAVFVCVFACQISGLRAADNFSDSLWNKHKDQVQTAGIGFGVALSLYGIGRLVGIDLGKHGPELATGAGILLGGTAGVYLAMKDTALESNLQAAQSELATTRENLQRIQFDFSALEATVKNLKDHKE